MKRDYLYGTDYTVLQKEGIYHFNSDTELLGRFMDVRKEDDVLDIGCGSGALMLYAAMRQPRSVTGIDLFAEVIEEARKNLEYNHVSGELIQGRIQDYEGRRFTCIVCNPPYFPTADTRLISQNPYIAAARHESFLNPQELFACAERLLHDNGRFQLVHRAERMHELLITASHYGLYCVRLKIAYQSEGRNAKSAAMEFRKTAGTKLTVEPPAYMDQRDTFAQKEEAI